MKFKFNYLENKLSRINPTNPEYSYQTPEERTFITQYGGRGFILGDNHWITFTVKPNQITVFYKKALNDGQITYYRRDFAKAEIISFEFTAQDRVEKNEKGYWIPKNGS